MKSNQDMTNQNETPIHPKSEHVKDTSNAWMAQIENDPSIPDPDDEVESFWAWLFVILLICAMIGLCIGRAACTV